MWATHAVLCHEAIKEGKTILLEGQLGSMKDPDLGIYPMTTSSSHSGRLRLRGRGHPRQGNEGGLSASPRHTPAQWAQVPLSASCSATRPRSCAAAAVTRANTAPPPAVPAEWAGSTAVATRYGVIGAGRHRGGAHLPGRAGLSGRDSRSAPATRSTARSPPISRLLPSLSRQSPSTTTLPGWKCDIRGTTKWEDLPQRPRRTMWTVH